MRAKGLRVQLVLTDEDIVAGFIQYAPVEEMGSRVHFVQHHTRDKVVLEEWGHADAIFVDEVELRLEPPPKEETIRKLVTKQLKKRRL